jgi:type I restriction enzyme M protein
MVGQGVEGDCVSPETLVAKLWSYCHVLRDEGVPVIAYNEQLTQLLFLKMVHERTQAPWNQPSPIPAELSWPTLLELDGIELEAHYRHILTELGGKTGTLGQIFRKATNHIQNPVRLKQLIVDLIDKEAWSSLDADVKGDAYEGLLQRGAEDTKSGAGQYFTPRPLIDAMVAVTRPEPGEVIADPAAGTAGFLLAAYEWIRKNNKLSRTQLTHLRDEALVGYELVDATARLAAMNLLLHGIGTPEGESRIVVGDALRNPVIATADVVLANPPFGTKSSITYVTGGGEVATQKETIARDDFWATTSNKQLNFLQHIISMLKPGGRAAVVLPDSVLFEGGAGAAVRKRLLDTCDLHTVLRLPPGIFYKPGVRANVLFFDKKPAREHPWTTETWFYDLRTNQHFTLKRNKLALSDLQPFIDAYCPKDRAERLEAERFRRFAHGDLAARDQVNLDITWLKDTSHLDADDLPDPEVLAAEIIDDLRAALADFEELASQLEREPEGDQIPS